MNTSPTIDTQPDPLSLAERMRADVQLVHEHLAGNEKAFSRIVRQHHTKLFLTARRYSRTEHDAWDILQEALLKASQRMHTFRAEATLSTWLHKLVSNTGYDFTHRRPHQRHELAVMDDDTHARAIDYRHSHDPFISELSRLALLAIMTRLPPEQREALYLIDIAGYTVEWVADYQDVAVGTVKSRRARARTKLQQLYTDPNEIEELLAGAN
ncbi:ECF RNA polymerase sigma factor SigM [Corynebacterium ciconiae DSM 44920]|uniref:sigma-70 family RNA polymerase sigma factor n=1 Tax=Corynebacterium ciconiae TaxID=227319 RepID=UPI0003A8E831|nr:sigma-70 family RNA polymerase sigma factor [Corynebacterium ciconiae]WKD62285.1 ECF RNA polymerase sigma factor SigM [Corynebacterium ciconiae DSM 44920]